MYPLERRHIREFCQSCTNSFILAFEFTCFQSLLDNIPYFQLVFIFQEQKICCINCLLETLRTSVCVYALCTQMNSQSQNVKKYFLMLSVIQKYIQKLPGPASKNVVDYSRGIFSFRERSKNAYSTVLMNSHILFSPDHFNSLLSKHLIGSYCYYKHIICYEMKLLILNISSSIETIAMLF